MVEEGLTNSVERTETRSARVHEPTAQGVERTLQTLILLGRSPQGLTISQIAYELGTSRPVVYRLVGALQAGGFALRGEDGKVRLGIEVLDLARQVYPVLRSIATPVLRKLADQAEATAHLTVVSNDEALALVVEEPTRTDMHVAYRVGATHRLDRGASGRAILAWREARLANASNPGSIGVSSAEMGGVPWVCSEGELQPGARGIAAPVRGVQGLEASVGVVCLVGLDEARIGPLVVQAADELAAILSN